MCVRVCPSCGVVVVCAEETVNLRIYWSSHARPVPIEGNIASLDRRTVRRDNAPRQLWERERRWEAFHERVGGLMQRIVLFGLLPPITWVMAAAVENLLF